MGRVGKAYGLYETLAEEESLPPPEDLEEAKRLAMHLLAARSSLVDFRSRFMPAPREVASGWFHHYWSDILLNGKKNFAAEGFRESGKTSLVVKGTPLHALTYPREDLRYIVFLLNNSILAQKRLGEIVEAYESNPDLSSNLVRTVEYKPSLGIYEAEVTDGETEHRVRIEAYGKGASIRGLSWNDRRPDLVIMDDPQDLEDMESDLILGRDWDWFLSEVKFLGKDTRIFLIGNNLGEKCIVEQCLANKEILEFDGMRIPVAEAVGEVPDVTLIKSNWPERYPIEFILNEKETYEKLGKSDIWWRERMCVATSPETQRFRKGMFRYYRPEEIRKKLPSMTKFTTVDLAIGQTKRSDFTVVCTVAVDGDNNWFILDLDYGRYNVTETMNAIFGAVQTWRPRLVGMEGVAYQVAMKQFLEREMSVRNCFFSIQTLDSERKKELRIEGMHPRFEAGKIFFPANGLFLPELEKELLAFPRGQHDDLIDALAYQEQVAAPPVGFSAGSDYYGERIPIAGGM